MAYEFFKKLCPFLLASTLQVKCHGTVTNQALEYHLHTRVIVLWWEPTAVVAEWGQSKRRVVTGRNSEHWSTTSHAFRPRKYSNDNHVREFRVTKKWEIQPLKCLMKLTVLQMNGVCTYIPWKGWKELTLVALETVFLTWYCNVKGRKTCTQILYSRC